VSNQDSVNIRPGVSILSVLRHLNYKPWYAIAEFVDNSIQSYLDYRDELQALEGKKFKLRVSIRLDRIDGGSIVIRDNAAGIHASDYTRAFRPAAIPPDQSGLSEFGMGMKSAACWFADNWTVRTSALGETVEKTVSFDIDKIVADNLEELVINSVAANARDHYTEVALSNLHRSPRGRTVGKIKNHLASIYRQFFRDGMLELEFNGEMLSYADPMILYAPYFKDEGGNRVEWRKEIDFDFGGGLEVSGFAGLLETASTSSAGFSLFRKSRVIEGSGDDGYRPEYIFKKPNSYVYQRMFGELHLSGFEVSHTKDGFRWDENEEAFLGILKEHLDSKPLPLISQAEGFRKRPKLSDIQSPADAANTRVVNVLEQKLPPVLGTALEESPDLSDISVSLPSRPVASCKEFDITVKGTQWHIVVELTHDPSVGDWIEPCASLVQDVDTDTGSRAVGIRMSVAHPFMQRFAGTDDTKIEGMLRLGVAICLAEVVARFSGVKSAGTFRREVNRFLRDALSMP